MISVCSSFNKSSFVSLIPGKWCSVLSYPTTWPRGRNVNSLRVEFYQVELIYSTIWKCLSPEVSVCFYFSLPRWSWIFSCMRIQHETLRREVPTIPPFGCPCDADTSRLYTVTASFVRSFSMLKVNPFHHHTSLSLPIQTKQCNCLFTQLSEFLIISVSEKRTVT